MELENFFKDTRNYDNTISKQVFSKQRMNLNPEVFKELNKEYIKTIYNETEYKTFYGYIVLL